MLLRDPRAPTDADGRPDGWVDVKGDLVAVDSDGTFEHPAIDEQWAREYAERQGATYNEVVVDAHEQETETCDAVKNDGEVCGRELPCPYHSD